MTNHLIMINELKSKVSDINQLVQCTHVMVNSQAKFTINESVKLDLLQQDINGLSEDIIQLRQMIKIKNNEN